MSDGNLENCVGIKKMTLQEIAANIQVLAGKIKQPLGIGIWEGEITGKISGQTYGPEHVGVFQDTTLAALFGPRGDAESEAASALFVMVVQNAEEIAMAISKTAKMTFYDSSLGVPYEGKTVIEQKKEEPS